MWTCFISAATPILMAFVSCSAVGYLSYFTPTFTFSALLWASSCSIRVAIVFRRICNARASACPAGPSWAVFSKLFRRRWWAFLNDVNVLLKSYIWVVSYCANDCAVTVHACSRPVIFSSRALRVAPRIPSNSVTTRAKFARFSYVVPMVPWVDSADMCSVFTVFAISLTVEMRWITPSLTSY